MKKQTASFKRCPNCGSQVPFTDLFCQVCGTNVANVSYVTETAQPVHPEKNDKPKKKIKKGKIIFFAVLGAILALIIAAAIIFFTGSAYDVSKKMKAGKYEKALDIYEDDVEDNFIQESILNIMLKDYDSKVVESFNAETITYEDAKEALETLEDMGFDSAAERISEIEILNSTKTAIANGEQHYANGDYEKAIEEYAKVQPESESYDDAQVKLNELYPKYINSIVEVVNSYNASKNYEDAVAYVNAAYDLLPEGVDAAALDNAKADSLAQYKAYILDEVTTLLSEKDFIKAMELLDDAIAVDNNQEFTNSRANTEKKYVAHITETVTKCLDEWDYSGAANAVQTALVVLPGNADLLALQTHVVKETPTNISSLVIIDSSAYSYKKEVLTDSFGNSYGEWHSLGNGYVIFNLNKKYTEFKCSFVANQTVDSNSKWNVAIYLDGEYAYTLSDYTRRSEKEDVVLDVENVTKLEIKCEKVYYYSNALSMVNATVK